MGKTWSERETTSWPTPISTRTGREESRPGSTNQPERLEDQQTELQRTLLLLLAQLVDSSAQLSIAQLKDTTCVLESKGFTPAEIKAAGWTVREARQFGVAVDIKRRNRSVEGLQANVQRIKEYRSKLIIFPTKNGKVGSSAEECASATQTA